ncbi:MAG TPA: hypothetical protein PKD64_01575 [Pirellulaceae bacterium]|nr:hypothetical protein [Pirellulaceae bacterium]HMO90859.1 hypothetical protein [Pirellulaceae bacterium]HMP68665.1 hypothetical protein [Pirellulaceae bacterium]
MMKNLLHALLHPVVTILAFMTVALLPGCGFKEELNKTRQTRKRVNERLNDMQNRAAIDFETQQMLNSVYAAYTGYLENRQTAPNSWSDLAGAPNLTSDQRANLRTAQRSIPDIQWGVDILAAQGTDEAGEKLLSLENPLLGNIIIMSRDGKISMVSQNE